MVTTGTGSWPDRQKVGACDRFPAVCDKYGPISGPISAKKVGPCDSGIRVQFEKLVI